MARPGRGAVVTVLLAAGLVLQVAVFARAFFPVPSIAIGHATPATERPPGPPRFGRLVIMLVDAMREDMLLSEHMPFARSLIFGQDGEALAYSAFAPPPTVTMPRIKGLISGTAPAFLDLVANLGSDALASDNLLYQLRAHGPPGVMGLFGDDTWLRLFPDYFTRADGTTSFFVADTVEVDVNVTRHIDSETRRDDWSVLIFHYLGLDHIGHLQGPRSPLMPAKLREMDDALARLHRALAETDASRELPSLLVLCSDHGMTEVRCASRGFARTIAYAARQLGSHGGSGPLETSSVLLLAAPRRSGVLAPRGADTPTPLPRVHQTDLVPTLATLLGVPIPRGSTGRIIAPALGGLPRGAQLDARRANAQQLVRLAHRDATLEARLSADMQRAAAAHAQYEQTGDDARAFVLAADAYDAVLSAAQAALSAAAAGAAGGAAVRRLCAATAGLALTAFAAAANLHADALAPSVGVAAARAAAAAVAVAFVLTDRTAEDDVLASSLAQWLPRVGTREALAAAAAASAAALPSALVPTCALPTAPALFVVAPVVLQPLLLWSSSFVEEEHFVWLWLCATALVVLGAAAVRVRDTRLLARIAAAALLFRLACAWNAHGVKWAVPAAALRAHLEAAGDGALALAVVASAMALGALRPRCGGGIARKAAAAAALIAIVAYRSFAPMVAVARLAYVLIALSAAWPRQRAWALAALALLLQRPAQAPLVPALLFLQRTVGSAVDALRLPCRPLWHIILAQAAFFLLGNSNAASTVDISGAYTGVDAYAPGTVGALTFLVTWSGPLLITLPEAARTTAGGERVRAAVAWLAWAAASAAVYSAVALTMREHLFVWSVFSPKYMYTMFWSLAWALAAAVTAVCA